ncbi:type IV secretory system conjugative DNA transfer family protein [Galenea microaerophila]
MELDNVPLIKPLAGPLDAIGLSMIGMGVASTMPYFAGMPYAPIAGAISAAIGAGVLTLPRIIEKYDKVDATKSEGFILPSAPVYEGQDGLIAGYTKDKQKPVVIPYQFLNRHMALIGASGVGKTNLGMVFIHQQIVKGGGAIFIDAKLDVDTRDALGYMMKSIGREDDLYILNLDDPQHSNTYNPLLEGDADDKASRVMNIAPSAENNPGADHYRQTANHALTVLFGAMNAINTRCDFNDLTILLQSSKAIEDLLRRLPPSPERMALDVFLDKYRVKKKVDDKWVHEVDTTKLKDALGGMAGRIAQFAQGKFGQIFNTYTPEIDLTDIIKNNKVLYVMLPTMSKDVAALNAAKMILSDLRAAVYNIQQLPKQERPNPKFLIFADEFGSYIIPSSASRLFEQARSANIILMPGFQSLGNLSEASPEFADILMQNNWCKAYFKFGSKKSAQEVSESFGKGKTFVYSHSQNESNAESTVALKPNPQFNAVDGDGMGESWREQEAEKISLDKLMGLGFGECILTIGPRMYHIQVPEIKTPITEVKGKEREKYVFYPYKRQVRLPAGTLALNYAKKYTNLLYGSIGMKNDHVYKENGAKTT